MSSARRLWYLRCVSLGSLAVACGGVIRGSDSDETRDGFRPNGAGGADGSSSAKSSGGSAGNALAVPPSDPFEAGTSNGVAGSAIGGTGAGGSGSGGGGGIAPGTCLSPNEDATTGLVTCDGRFAHRPRVVSCEAVAGVPPETGGAPADVGGAGGESSDAAASAPPKKPRAPNTGAQCTAEQACAGNVHCKTDQECAAFARGYCAVTNVELGGVCRSGCLTDADCGAHAVCLCRATDHGGECYAAACKTDADCGERSFCILQSFDYGFFCQ